MGNPIFKAVKNERDSVSKDLDNAKAYLTKATEEKQQTQQKVNNLQDKLDLLDAWLLANPDV
jgi:F0F1-type ATP synthase membrane subunit b/b'